MDQVLGADAEGRFVAELDEAAATGYRWTFVALPPEIRLEGEEVIPGGPALGSPRRRIFRLAASRPGSYRIAFELRRPWEQEAVEVRHVDVRVGG